MAIIELDVSELAAPEPIQEILKAIASLNAGQVLKVFHRRAPVPLFKLLDEQAIAWHHQQLSEEQHLIYIWQQKDSAAGQFIYRTLNLIK